MGESILNNEKVTELYLYIVQHSDTDTEYWYGGISDVNSILATFDRNDIKDLVNTLIEWRPELLSNLAFALTADDDRGLPAVRSYLYAHIFLILDNPELLNVIDDFDYLLNSDDMVSPLVPDIRRKLNEYNFLNYDRVAIGNCQVVLNKLNCH
ncbi:hypothetical protein [Pedobacter heparinus]|uniref:Immunity protein 30 domain-containing protein n=1 Tax=Pedobacter heparinus (strain ATCC 13125 / DSM 2366 / CIP 104194 / JCM 7457 / NBRC 12017 / NCIMB 9290 / NRRL B-14731 / HIM 762-3) TaxID=485917 RepID=C6XXT1_PEDHD|nr:hypothetical protein [Pedobacter heparinus]ACU04349.1 hypothetical protein Phep_2145 [Pedobacter heparinus DSM 2366]